MDILKERITDKEGIKRYVDWMREKQWDFHFEDCAHQIQWMGCTVEPTWDQMELMNTRNAECLEIDEDFVFDYWMEKMK